MENKEILTTDASRLSFLYKKISMPRVPMSYWLQVPEFVEEMNRMLSNNKDINNQIVHAIMVSIYERILPLKGTAAGEIYNYSKLRQGIKRLSEAIQLQA